MSFKDLILRKEVIVAILSSAVSIFIAILSMKKGKNKPLQKEQLETIYFPIFINLEEIFYRYSEDEAFSKKIDAAYAIVQNNRLIAGNDLYEHFWYFYQNPCEESFDSLSNFIIKKYNSLLKKNGLSKVSSSYRAKNKLYDRFGLTFFYTRLIFTGTVRFLIMLILTLIIFLIFNTVLNRIS
mgnify:FL=1